MNITNVNVYGLSESIHASGYPMRVDLPSEMDIYANDTSRAIKLAGASIGTGHDNFLNGIIVQFDLTAPIKMWTEMQRYHFMDFVSSQSTMHRLRDMDLDTAFDSDTDPRIIEIMKELQADYRMKVSHSDVFGEQVKEAWMKLILSCPVGLNLTARMTTNYRQLKTIYAQRKSHRLPHWRKFCSWIETLPCSEFMTGHVFEVKPLP